MGENARLKHGRARVEMSSQNTRVSGASLSIGRQRVGAF